MAAARAREKELERQAFYRQLGETAKLSHTFVNPPLAQAGSSRSQFASAARHTGKQIVEGRLWLLLTSAPPIAPHPMRIGPETVTNLTAEALNHLNADMARLQQPDTTLSYTHHPPPQAYAPLHHPTSSIYPTPQPAVSASDLQAFARGYEASEWEQ
jgi:hypothetical protein